LLITTTAIVKNILITVTLLRIYAERYLLRTRTLFRPNYYVTCDDARRALIRNADVVASSAAVFPGAVLIACRRVHHIDMQTLWGSVKIMGSFSYAKIWLSDINQHFTTDSTNSQTRMETLGCSL